FPVIRHWVGIGMMFDLLLILWFFSARAERRLLNELYRSNYTSRIFVGASLAGSNRISALYEKFFWLMFYRRSSFILVVNLITHGAFIILLIMMLRAIKN